jgi:lipopolysaccharide export system protein LptC
LRYGQPLVQSVRRWLHGLALSILTAIACCSLFAFHRQQQQQEQRYAAVDFDRSALSAEMFTLFETDGNASLSGMTGSKLEIKPRRYFVFNIKPLNEALLIDARYRTNLSSRRLAPPSKASGEGKAPIASIVTSQQRSPLLSEGLVTRCRIDGFEWDVYQDGVLAITVTARSANMNFRARTLSLTDVSIEHPATRRVISAQSAVWHEERQQFDITDEYRVTTPQGVVSGNAIQLNLDFVAHPLS